MARIVNASSASASLTPANVTRTALGNCAECGLRITSLADACEAMGCIYHNSCFVCCCCRRSLRGKVFYKDQSKVYCEEDYLVSALSVCCLVLFLQYCGFQRTAEKCVVCGHIIAELILQALGQYYHPGCFRCTICNEALEDLPFTVDDMGAIYCMKDYALVHSPRCAKCGMPILPAGSSASLLNVNPTVHLHCLGCHIAKIGATPASGQDYQSLPRYSTSNSTSTTSSPIGKNSPTGNWFSKS
ncbi:hypothetical protein Ciccas_008640 [Cichlidogyrus casuarinus]|uniref:LIM zinc-binding domain-containing protein n=1 Tax=Cichlidogyrus casuarinus TaxID=1844966 RepID=A0ABD2Q0Y1_9PLAT